MRELTTHKISGVNEALVVNAVDGPGPGGASHHYVISGFCLYVPFAHGQSAYEAEVDLRFQNGPAPGGANGITHEALLAVLIDRLHGFQSGQFRCHENNMALMHLCKALEYLQHRTRERLKRGVEGTLTP